MGSDGPQNVENGFRRTPKWTFWGPEPIIDSNISQMKFFTKVMTPKNRNQKNQFRLGSAEPTFLRFGYQIPNIFSLGSAEPNIVHFGFRGTHN